MNNHPEDVAKHLVGALSQHGFHGSEHCQLRTQPKGMLKIDTSFADTDTELTVIVRKTGQVAREYGYVVFAFNFVDGEVVLHEEQPQGD